MTDRTDNARAACGCDLSVGPNALHIVDDHDGAAARAEAERRYPVQHERVPGAVLGVTYQVADERRGAFVAGAEWAAGRTETTTATIEDAAQVLWERFGARQDAPLSAWLTEQDCRRFAETLASRGLLAHPFPGRDAIARALDRAGAFCGECGAEPGDFFDSCPECRRWLRNYADAVLDLLRGGGGDR